MRWIRFTAYLFDSALSVWLQHHPHKPDGAQVLFLALREVGGKLSLRQTFWVNELRRVWNSPFKAHSLFFFFFLFNFLYDSCSAEFANDVGILQDCVRWKTWCYTFPKAWTLSPWTSERWKPAVIRQKAAVKWTASGSLAAGGVESRGLDLRCN